MCGSAPLDEKPTLQPLSVHTGGSRAPFDCFQFTVNINQTLGHRRAPEAAIGFAPRDDAIRAVERSVFMRISRFPSSLEKRLFKKNKRNKNRLFTFSHEVQGSSRESELRYVAHIFSSCDKPRALHYICMLRSERRAGAPAVRTRRTRTRFFFSSPR